MIGKKSMLALVACTGVALCAGNALADEVQVAKPAGPAFESVKVVKDKQTGKLRAPTPEEAEAMAQRPTSRLAPNVVVVSRPATTMVTRPDGGATIRRSVDELDSVVAQRSPDGKLTVRHKDAPVPSTPNLPKE